MMQVKSIANIHYFHRVIDMSLMREGTLTMNTSAALVSHVPLNMVENLTKVKTKASMKAMRLSLDEVKTYDANPRKHRNSAYNELKDSIRERGVDIAIHVTQRPSESFYMVEAGGNTRLTILQELWKETGDERFYYLDVLYRPWISELHVLTAHLTENLMRADMCFYDRASAILSIKQHLEMDEQCAIKWAKFERRLASIGIKHSHGQIVRMRYLLETLVPLIPETVLPDIGPHHVQRLQSCFKEVSERFKGNFMDEYQDEIKEIFQDQQSNIEGVVDAISKLVPLAKSQAEPNPLDAKYNTEYNFEDSEEETIEGAVTSDSPLDTSPLDQKELATSDLYVPTEQDEDSPSEYDVEQNIESPSKQYIYQLQRIIELRSKLYHQARELIGDDVWVTDNAFGFGVNITDNDCPIEDLLGQMSAYGLGSRTPSIDVSKFFSITPKEFTSFMRILSLSKQIVDMSHELYQLSIIKDSIDDLNNSMIVDIQNELDPEIKAENELIRRYIQHGATNAMLYSLFPFLFSGEVAKIREELSIENHGGRPLKAMPFEADKIIKLNHKLQDIGARERYLLIAEDIELPLSSIWNTLKSLEFSDHEHDPV